MIAVREAWNAGLFKREHWMRNLVSGLIVGVVALPLAMAFAIASGVKPEQGIYTAIIGGLLVSLLGGSRLQIAGPTGAFIVILAGVTAKYGVEGLQLATMMAGAILLVLGITRLGAVIKFIPDPVIVGFTAGIGIIIWVGQWRDFFGLPEIEGGHFHEKLWHLLLALPDLHIATTLLATCSLALLILAPRLPVLKRLPGPLVAMVFATLVQSLFHFDGVATIGTAFGAIPQGLPSLTWPEVSLARVIELIGPAFAIAMLGAIESLLSAVVADGMAGTRHDSNQELIGQGVANLVVPLFGGFAATGAIARTATNIRNGATGPLAGIIHALTLVLIILFLAPLASNIPLCALAAILFVVAYNMSELKHFKRMLQRAPRADIAILLVTFTLTVFSDLVIAVNIGVILAMLQFMRRMASSVEVQQVVEEELANELHSNGQKSLPPGVLVYTIEGPLFFGAAETFERALSQTHTDPELLVICLKRVPFMDITGLQTLEEVIQQLHERQIVVKLCEANGKVLGKLEKAGILRLLGPGHYHQTLGTALLEAKAPAAHN
ncbi:sodium-independent anion transporter [Pseudomonas plecoglossicida]|uniref:Sodium-independent anion transporter n=1 Tax=Pseudomonas plecoglossicida TaxID=70775 RepID=A0A2A3M4N4_PSEDL|nr:MULTISPECIES: SulP family inorganic anion transporter [Pseudomonas]MBF8802405.1 STAS domain-containing protein [Pseudomonas asiatica]MBH3378539.1 STAS domain-containing protein [Pseudomonas asiatica]MBO2889948.1 STAS domain-containing protein [Pseudomonas asiatica]MCK2119332.1 SulP family inorganic anion transporter [Pseudomonas sp. PNPG3]MDD1980660.1 SulP family inorganic anion transporter [Pseudomonas asiatica]